MFSWLLTVLQELHDTFHQDRRRLHGAQNVNAEASDKQIRICGEDTEVAYKKLRG